MCHTKARAHLWEKLMWDAPEKMSAGFFFLMSYCLIFISVNRHFQFHFGVSVM